MAKYAVFGCAIGLVLALLWVFGQLFLGNRKAWSRVDIEHRTGIPTLAVYDNRAAVSKDWIIRQGIAAQTSDWNVADAAAYEPILTSRIESLLSGQSTNNLYLYDTATPAFSLGDSLAYVVTGAPERSVTEMEQFLAVDNVILVTRMHETTMAELGAFVNLCQVHGKKILGNILIYA